MNDQKPGQAGRVQLDEANAAASHSLAKKLDAVGWGLFFVWVGIAFLADLGLGVGLLGVGVITLGEQAVRAFSNLKLEGFWVVIGLLFLLGGIWELFEPEVELIPVLLILVGLVWLASALWGKHAQKE